MTKSDIFMIQFEVMVMCLEGKKRRHHEAKKIGSKSFFRSTDISIHILGSPLGSSEL